MLASRLRCPPFLALASQLGYTAGAGYSLSASLGPSVEAKFGAEPLVKQSVGLP